MIPPPDPLDPLLDCWADSPVSEADVTSNVWRRIAKAEAAGPAPTGFWEGLGALISRPPVAALFVTSCALLGLFLAEVRINRHERERSAELARSYVRLIDPLMKANAEAKAP
jgi:hypothetical protein